MKFFYNIKLFKCLLFLLILINLFNLINFNFPKMRKGYDAFISNSKYGEIYYFSKFFKSRLIDLDRGVKINYYYKKDMKSLFFKKMRYGVAPMLIFPSKIKINNNYNHKLNLSEFNYLKNQILISKTFREHLKFGRKKIIFNYLILEDYKPLTNEWAIFEYSQNGTSQIFVLPLDWTDKIKVETL